MKRKNNRKKVQTLIQLPKLISEGATSTKKHERKVPSKRYLFKVNNRNTRKRCKMYSNLTIETSE